MTRLSFAISILCRAMLCIVGPVLEKYYWRGWLEKPHHSPLACKGLGSSIRFYHQIDLCDIWVPISKNRTSPCCGYTKWVYLRRSLIPASPNGPQLVVRPMA